MDHRAVGAGRHDAAGVVRIKAFISRNTDRFRLPYGRRMIESKRQCVFVGTVNHHVYFRDETGGRRFWPVMCGRIDLDLLRRDRDQLWAEAVERYHDGEHWWLEGGELNAAAAEEQDARYLSDAWEPKVAAFLDDDNNYKEEVTTADVLERALLKPIGTWTHGDQIRVGAILRHLGWEPHRPRGGGRGSVPTGGPMWSGPIRSSKLLYVYVYSESLTLYTS